MRSNVFLLGCLLCTLTGQAQHTAVDTLKTKLLKAYAGMIKAVENNQVLFINGIKLPLDDHQDKTAVQLNDQADIEDMFRMKYVKGETSRPGAQDDPGRIRNDSFFKSMYGATMAAVKKNLTTITWLPNTAPQKLQVTTVNGVHEKLLAISAELEAQPALLQYVRQAAGTFNWRVIKGTTRLSTHSYGIAIDINTDYSHYWQWDNKTTDEYKPIPIYRNSIPWEIVAIFEKHGFIWGGKWYHYDTMHFEYRPELLAGQ